MTKLKWDREPIRSSLNSDYWLNPKKGFDKDWHDKKSSIYNNLGIHKDHDWQIINKPSGPHAGKIVCSTCEGKWIAWLPKGYISPNT